MNRLSRTAAALLAALALLSLAACGSRAPEVVPAEAAGRYVEEELELPEGLGEVLALDQLGETLWMAACDGDRLRIWSSADFGSTWTTRDYPWLETGLPDGQTLMSASFDESGGLYLYAYTYDENNEPAFRHHFYLGGAETLAPLDLACAEPSPSLFHELRALPDGELYVNSWEELQRVDVASGRTISTLNGLAAKGSWRVADGRTYAVRDDAIEITGPDGGNARIPIDNPSPFFWGYGFPSAAGPHFTAVAPAGGDAVYFADETGLYRAAAGGSLTERLLDASLCSLGLPTTYLQYLFERERAFLALCGGPGGGYRLYRYTYDPDVPAQPSTALRVWALADSDTLRLAAGHFQAANPDVRVAVELGMEGGDAVTAADALSAFSAALLAGRGPDVIVLDGLPLAGYLDKGVLADLAPALDGLELIPAATALTGGTVRAVPARVHVPVLYGMGEGEPAASARSLDAFADWMEAAGAIDIGIGAEDLLDRLYAGHAPAWLESGALDEDALLRDLRAMRRIAVLQEPREETQWGGAWVGARPRDGALAYKEGRVLASFGMITDFEQLSAPYSLFGEAGGALAVYPETLLPACVLGVNAGGGDPDLAARFVTTALSPGVQSAALGDGLPVNLAAIGTAIAHPGESAKSSDYMTRTNNRTGETLAVELHYDWPSEAVMNGWRERLQTLAPAPPADAALREIILAEATPYISGERDFDEMAAALRQKLGLYIAEQG